VKPQKSLILSVVVCGGALSFAGCSMASEAGGGGIGAGGGDGYFSGITTTNAATGGGAWGPGGMSGMVGAACAKDQDCGGLLSCLGPDRDDPSFGGGPAGGFCSRSCGTNEDCPGTNGVCLKDGDSATGSCTIACTIGPQLARDYEHPLDPDKCHGRQNVRCEKVKSLGAVCLPTCGSDAECGRARVCDPNRAMCVSTKSVGLPTGAVCDASTKPTTCAGRCVSFDAGSASCSSPCVLGGSSPTSLDCGGPTEGLCAFSPDDNGPGDVGYCTRSCRAHNECTSPGFWCFSVSGLTEEVGNGYCFGATPCKGQSDCSKPGQATPYTCTSTPKGSFCIDRSFPFEKAAGPVP
jgi:hypothetical protein